MGLDMYLTKKTYIGNYYRKPEEQIDIIAPEKEENALFPIRQSIKKERIETIEERVGYWRKANQIHKWFVDNIQDGEDDCGSYEVPEEKLNNLLELCKKVKSKNSLAESLLPSASGFFFGNTQYDDWYFKQIDETIEIIESLWKERGESKYLPGEIYYRSSW